MISLQLGTTITIGRYRSLVNNRRGGRMSRIHLGIGNQHIIRGSITFPRDIRISIARVDRNLRYFVDILTILNRQIIKIEQVLTVETADKCHIGARAIV